MLDLLARFVQESDVLCMSEAQAYLWLPYFLTSMGENQCNAVRQTSGVPERGGTCWPEAVNYPLSSYSTRNAIHRAIVALRDTKQTSR